jgi:hypothetical protein
VDCFDCRHLGAKVGTWYRCHSLPEALANSGAIKYQRFPRTYHCEEHPCPDFKPKTKL